MRKTAPSVLSSPAHAPARSLIALWLAVCLGGCSKTPKADVSQQDRPLATIDAEVVTLELSPWPSVVRSQGSLFADEQTVVGAKVAGRVRDVHVDLGDFVQLGTPLVTLDQEEFELQVAQADAQLQQARSAVGLHKGDRVEDLVPENAAPVRQEKAPGTKQRMVSSGPRGWRLKMRSPRVNSISRPPPSESPRPATLPR